MPIYFEQCWSILSSIGIGNVLFGGTVLGITGLSASTLIPIVVSAAGAVANGLCYYVYYENPPAANATAASVGADIMWLIQEAGISFYSYIILEHILNGRQRAVFRGLFWSLMAVVLVMRILILVMRLRAFANPDSDGQFVINGLHAGYFVSIAAVECVSAYFLLRKFMSAKKLSSQADLGTRLFQHLMRSTEIRLATLALIGVTRAVTYFFQNSPQRATGTPSQIDRFVYTLECLFPIMLYIDILASKITYTRHTQDVSLPYITSHTHGSPKGERFFSVSRQPESAWYEEIGARVEDGEDTRDVDGIITSRPPRRGRGGQWQQSPSSQHGGAHVTKPPQARGQGIVKTVEVTVE